MLGNRLAQEGVALFGTVAMEGFAAAFVVHGLVHGREHGRRKRFGDVADAQADDFGVGVFGLIFRDAMRDFGEKVGGLNLQVVLVDADHFVLAPLGVKI